jgi:hypothetical protein
MKGLIIRGGWWWRWMPAVYTGMAVFPFIFFRHLHATDRLLQHERIHLRQQLETGILPFYLWYLMEYIVGRLRGQNHMAAYMRISFEREAFSHESDPDYLSHRRVWAFLDYLKS